MKTNPLPPSQREKKRYIVYEHTGNKQSFVALKTHLEKAFHNFLGELGTAKAGIQLLPDQYNYTTQRGIIRVNHKHVNHVKATFALANIPIKSIATSGVLNKAKTHT